MLGDIAAWFVGSIFAFAAYRWLLLKYPTNFLSNNFQGRQIPSGAGLILVLAADPAFTWIVRERFSQSAALVEAAMAATVGFGILGVLDDLYGDRSTGGLKGHFRKLFFERKFTTGALKAVGGAVLAITAGLLLHPAAPLFAAAAATQIALSANAVNLTDTRPGRSLSVVLVFGLIGAAFAYKTLTLTECLIFAPLFVIAMLLYIQDRQGKIMIGDAGANALGATVGLLWSTGPIYSQALLLILLIWFHFWTEKNSLNHSIERRSILRRIDRWTGIRQSNQ